MHAVYRLAMLLGLLVLLVTPVSAASDTTTGAIRGAVNYPSHFIPPLRVYAINTTTGNAYYVTTVLNQSTFAMAGLPAGTYHVLARPLDTPDYIAGYSAAVPCGLAADCTDHTLLPVTVTVGATTSGVNVFDWYAPPGTFPPEPADSVPAPLSHLPAAGASTVLIGWLSTLMLALLVTGFTLRRIGQVAEESKRSGSQV